MAAFRSELVAYAVLTCLLLRRVGLGDPPFRWPIKGNAEWLSEASLRQTIYQTTLRSVGVLTVLLAVALTAKYFA